VNVASVPGFGHDGRGKNRQRLGESDTFIVELPGNLEDGLLGNMDVGRPIAGKRDGWAVFMHGDASLALSAHP
jgi:hypothetical protein